MNWLGSCVLAEAYSKSVDPTDLPKAIKYKKTQWIQEFTSLTTRPRPSAPSSTNLASKYYELALNAAFNMRYLDPHNLVSHYCRKLSSDMDNWTRHPNEYIAPYTSVINSSMMGKSRLIKQISLNIPTVYICLREVDDGYPAWSAQVLRDYLLRSSVPDGDAPISEQEYTSNISMLAFFSALFEHLLKFGMSRATSEQFRHDLWFILAQPLSTEAKISKATVGLDEDIIDVYAFWATVVKNARDKATETSGDLLVSIHGYYTKLRPMLNCKIDERDVDMLLIVWDEARTLVHTGLDGLPLGDRTISKFRIVRRTTRQIGNFNSSSPTTMIRMFTLVTDTSSHIANFQPRVRYESSSARKEKDLTGGPRRFAPIVTIPSFDYHARDLPVTCKYQEVDQASRLIRFGRAAWFAMLSSKTHSRPVDLLPLAEFKLFRTDLASMKEFFQRPTSEDVRQRMLACLGPRLAIQTGSNTTMARELVASHMMVLLKVGKDHEQVEGYYPSEPILAEASSQATARFGWAKPLETLISVLRHGIVDKGFRGEFLTKVLLSIAMEDTLRPTTTRKKVMKSKWGYSRTVSVGDFLTNLFRDPKNTNPSPDCPPTEIENPTFEPLPKTRKRSLKDDSSNDTQSSKKTKPTYDDWDSADEDEDIVESTDEVPTPDNFSFQAYLIKSAKAKSLPVDVQKILKGRIFFNHFVSLDTVLRPSVLIKAWNRGAAIMTKACTPGIDFIIPVIMEDCEVDKLGPLFGEWTRDQEEAADKIVAYIVIDGKNRENRSETQIGFASDSCIPKPTQSQFQHKNFDWHTPCNPFISIVLSFGWETNGPGVEVHSIPTAPIHKLHLPIIAYGLTSKTYKCLDSRPNVARMMRLMRDMDRNPIRGLGKNSQIAAGVRDCLPLKCHPGREWSFTS